MRKQSSRFSCRVFTPPLSLLFFTFLLALSLIPSATGQQLSQQVSAETQEQRRLRSVLPADCSKFLPQISAKKGPVELNETEILHPTTATVCGARAGLLQHQVVSFSSATVSAIGQIAGVTLPEPHIATAFQTRSGRVDHGPDQEKKARELIFTHDHATYEQFVQTSVKSFASETAEHQLSVAFYLDPSNRFHLYESLGGPTEQARPMSIARMKQWADEIQKHAAEPPLHRSDPLRLGADQAVVPPTTWTFLFDFTETWTDGNNNQFTAIVTTYRLNEYNTKDWYLVLTEFSDTGSPSYSCPSYPSGWGWCGPMMTSRGISYSNDPPLQLLQERPLNNNPMCNESFTMGDNLTAQIGVSYGSNGPGVSAGESTTITSSNGISCGQNVVTVTDNTSGGSASWQEYFNPVPEILLNQPPDPVLSGNFVSDQAAIYTVDDGALDNQRDDSSFVKTFTFTTQADGGTVFNCGFLGLSACYDDYMSSTTVSFKLQIFEPVFTISPQQFQLCSVPSNSTATEVVNVTNFIPAPVLLNASGSLGGSYYNSHTGEFDVNPAGLFTPTQPQSPTLGALDWLPGQLPASNWIGVSPSGWVATTPTPFPFYVRSGIPAESPAVFVISTNPTNAAPSEDFSSNSTSSNTPNGLFVSVITFGTPTVTGVNPSSAPPGQPVTITGTNFMDGSQVFFGTLAGSIQSVNHPPECTTCPPDTITVVPPLGSGTVPVSVKTACGTSPSFTGMALPSDQPLSALMRDGSTPMRAEFRIVGLRAQTGQATLQASQVALRSSSTANERHSMTHSRLMRSPGHPPTTPTYTFWPNVWPNGNTAAISPQSAPMTGGTVVTIRGNGFTGATAVSFGSVPGTISSIDTSGNSLQAVMPQINGCGSVDVTVTTPVGTSPVNSWDQINVTKAGKPGCIHPLPWPDHCFFGGHPWISCYLDISETSHLAEILRTLAYQNITLNVGPHQFCPACSITRGDWAATLTKAFDLPQPSQSVALRDLPRMTQSQANYLPVQAATPYLGFFLQRDGFAFRPTAPVNRQAAISSVVSILANRGILKLLKSEDAEDVLEHVHDSSTIDAPLRIFVSTAIKRHLFEGTSPDAFGAHESLRRDEAASILYEALRRMKP